MAIESVLVRTGKLANGKDQEELQALLSSLVDGLQALAAKLDADTGVTDTNYAATLANFVID